MVNPGQQRHRSDQADVQDDLTLLDTQDICVWFRHVLSHFADDKVDKAAASCNLDFFFLEI